MVKILICGAGGFIGGHLASKFSEDKNTQLICADLKPEKYWFQKFEKSKNFSLDLKDYDNALKVSDGVDYIFNFACNMGGMGFIENNKAECMLSVLVNTNLLEPLKQINVRNFSSSACVYNASKQNKTFIRGLREQDACQLIQKMATVGKLFSERMCRHFTEDFGIETRVASIIMFMDL